MKSRNHKTTLKPRNPLVAMSFKPKAGIHRKSNKALRRLEKSQGGYSSIGQSIRLLTGRCEFDPRCPYQRVSECP